MKTSQKEKAEKLRALHQGPDMLLFPNVWDAASACIIENLGFPAVATSSAAVANMLGYADGQRIRPAEMLEAISRVAGAVNVPVTADMEGGYCTQAEQMRQTALRLIEAGAVGLNLEDGEEDETRLADLGACVEKIHAIKESSKQTGVALVINARTDAYWLQSIAPTHRFVEAVRRANAYRGAGADCIFVPGMQKIEEIVRFLHESPGPLNVLAGPGAPSIGELKSAGVRRVSLGSGAYRASLGLLREVATELREKGTYEGLVRYGIPFSEVNDLFVTRESAAVDKK